MSSPESFWFELFKAKSSGHRLVSVGQRQTQGSHHLNSAMHELIEIETVTLVSSSEMKFSDEGIQETRHEDAKPVTSNSNLQQQVIEHSSGRNTFVGTRPNGEK